MPRVLAICFLASVLASQSAAAAALAKIPFDITENHTFIEVIVNGERLSFVFDTGASATAINEATAERLGLEATGRYPATGVGGTTYVSVASGLTLELGALRLDGVTAGLVALGHLEEALDRPLDGIIGREVLDGRVVVLDYDRRSLDVYARDAFPFDWWGVPCPLEKRGGVARVHAEVRLLNGDVLDGWFFVDTGAGLFLSFNTWFAETHRLAERVGDTYSRIGRALTGQPIEERVGRVAAIRLCGHDFPSSETRSGDRIPVHLGLGTEGVQGLTGPAGIIGNEIFKRFNAAFDFEGSRMYLAPNGRWDAPIRTDASGLFLIRADDGSVRIAQVFADSPAQRAGLLAGEAIRVIDGIAADTMTLPQIRERLTAAGDIVRFEVDRDGVSRVVELRLRPNAGR